jgi:16S rRNA (adenine1518-N6/adenine1519-N6)-dimethyltransferase
MTATTDGHHRARKRFGQNFLVREDIIHAIIQAVNANANDRVVEIGPGLGALTDHLLQAAGALDVIEIDRDLAARLHERQDARLTVHETDVLKVDFNSFLPDASKLRIVGNLPYNISTPLLLKLAKCHERVKDLHVMLQLEVVERLVATSGNKTFGRLSVMMQSVFAIEQILAVPPDAFKPAPKVQSAVARLTPHANVPSRAQLEALESATRLAFGNKRKTLRNNFKHTLSESELTDLDVNPDSRAETLSLDAFHRLAGAIVSKTIT